MKVINEGMAVDVVYLDKVFVKVPHGGLIQKIKTQGRLDRHMDIRYDGIELY